MQKESVREQKAKALSISIKEGSASSASANLGDMFITPLAVEITPKENQNIIVGLLSSFSLLISQLAQIAGSRMIKKFPRKRIVLTLVFIQACLWLPIVGLSFIVWKGITPSFLPIILVILYSAIALATGLHYPAWFSWMGDLVPAKIRGKYFSRRNLTLGVIGLVIAIVGSIILKETKSTGFLLLGFTLIFFLAFVFRLISYVYLKKQYAPKGGYKREAILSYKEFKKTYPNFMKFSYYQAWFNFAIMFASPFFAVYMLTELGLKDNYLLYMIIAISSTAFYLLFLPLIGKISDRYGNRLLLYVANIAFVLSPIMWLFSQKPIYLICVQFVAGLGNAALVISTTNFTYASVSKHHRSVGIAYSSVLIGIGTFTGALLGGAILNYIPITFMNKFFFIFIVAALLRALVAIIFLPRLKEVQHVKAVHLNKNILHPFNTLNSEIHTIYETSKSSYSEGLKIWKLK